MSEKRFKIKSCDLDAYAEVIESMRDACIARGVNFRGVMIELATTWMSGKVAAAGSVSCPVATEPQPERRPDVRQSIVRKPVQDPPASAQPAPSALARSGAAVMLAPAASPAAKVVQLLQLREEVDAELGRLMAAMGIPMPAVNATTPAPVREPVEPEKEQRKPEPAAPREKRSYTPRAKLSPLPATAASGVPKRNKPMVTDDFPGRLFNADQVRSLCGVGMSFPLSSYVHNGTRVAGKHVFRYATAAEIAAASTSTPLSVFSGAQETSQKLSVAREPEPEPDDEEGDAPADANGGGRASEPTGNVWGATRTSSSVGRRASAGGVTGGASAWRRPRRRRSDRSTTFFSRSHR